MYGEGEQDPRADSRRAHGERNNELKKRPQTALLDKKLEGIDLGGRGSLHTRPPRRGSLDLSISDIFADAYSPLRSLPDPARDR